jgi:anti-sigma regulatory factor (Ser/Thr protein kinase)
MRELSLHILDIVENAVQAGAKNVSLRIIEDFDRDRLVITIVDDGRGMDAETVHRVRDPFFTTRTTRHVGLGIPLFAAAAERCGGTLAIESTLEKGTTIRATFRHSHIDRVPLGDMPGTLMGILMRDQDFDLTYEHRCIQASVERAFEFDTVQIKQILGDVPLDFPTVRDWLKDFIAQGEQQLKEISNAKTQIP